MSAKAKCAAKTKAGTPCRMAPGPSGFCFVHDPARGAERAQARSAGGRARHTPHGSAPAPAGGLATLADVRDVLSYALAEALVMDNGVARGGLLVSIARAGVEAWKVGEFEQRLAAIETLIRNGAPHGVIGTPETTRGEDAAARPD